MARATAVLSEDAYYRTSVEASVPGGQLDLRCDDKDAGDFTRFTLGRDDLQKLVDFARRCGWAVA